MLNQKNKYIDIDDTDFLNKNNKNTLEFSKIIISNIKITYNDNSTIIKKKVELYKNVSKMNYSYDIFSQNSGIDFLTFQLYNIFSKIRDDQLLNLYLYETLSFIMKLFSYSPQNFIKKEERLKLESQVVIFFLTLLNLLQNNKDKIYLNNHIILSLIELYGYFNTIKLIN